jgi:holo-[acyl-carrier protein] synthase
MAFAGVGVNMLKIERMRRAIARHPSLIERAFTKEERKFCEKSAHPASYYAARFAARKAVSRALGYEVIPGMHIQDVSVSYDVDSRQPRVVLAGRAAEIASQQGVQEIALSLSFNHDVAVANAVALTDQMRPRQDEKPNKKNELRKTFRQARSVLDDLDAFQRIGDIVPTRDDSTISNVRDALVAPDEFTKE